MMTIRLEAEKDYTVQEVIELVRQALNFIGKQAPPNDLQYSASDVYWTLRALLDYINERVPGEFVLKRLEKGCWKLEYIDEKAAKRKADEQHRREIKRTADFIQNLTGKRPFWG